MTIKIHKHEGKYFLRGEEKKPPHYYQVIDDVSEKELVKLAEKIYEYFLLKEIF